MRSSNIYSSVFYGHPKRQRLRIVSIDGTRPISPPLPKNCFGRCQSVFVFLFRVRLKTFSQIFEQPKTRQTMDVIFFQDFRLSYLQYFNAFIVLQMFELCTSSSDRWKRRKCSFYGCRWKLREINAIIFVLWIELHLISSRKGSGRTYILVSILETRTPIIVWMKTINKNVRKYLWRRKKCNISFFLYCVIIFTLC